MKASLNIVLVGDVATGKTSIILSLVGEEFIENVPPRVDNITIPAEMSQDGVTTNIIDTSLQEQDEIEIADCVRQADVVCVVCDCSNISSFHSVENFWLGLVRDSSFDGPRKPVIIVCNKADLVEEDQIECAVEMMDKHFQIATCVMASALTLKNISELFYYSQMSFLYPVPVLYDAERFSLTEQCREAFARIFQICDQNNDGILDDDEMCVFQKFCFGFSLAPTALMEIKSMLYSSSDSAVKEGGITREGFLHLQVVFIQRNQQVTTWNILRKFGYDEDLTLGEVLQIERLDLTNSAVEMTEQGLSFVNYIFDKHDTDNDGFLSFSDLSQLSILDPSFFFNDTLYFDIIGRIGRKLFLLMWRAVAHLDPIPVLRALVYFGFSFIYGPVESAITILPRQPLSDSKRSVFFAKVLSTSFKSKVELFSQFQLKHPALRQTTFGFDEVYVDNSRILLILEDISPSHFSQDQLPFCDGVCLLYDGTDPSSFEYCARVFMQVRANSPVVVLRTNGELRQVKQDNVQQPEAFCSAYCLPLVDFSAVCFRDFLGKVFLGMSRCNGEDVGEFKFSSFGAFNVSLTLSLSMTVLLIGFFIGRFFNK